MNATLFSITGDDPPISINCVNHLIMKKKWYESWFDSPFYHILYQNRDHKEAAKFINTLIDFLEPKKGAKMIDLGCGKGRHAFQLAEKGFEVTGLDLSPQSIATAKKQCLPNLFCDVHDMREPYKKSYFDYVFSFFTSFGYFDDSTDDIKSLQAVYENLKDGGFYVLDFFNKVQVEKQLKPYEEKVINHITFKISKKIENGFIFKNIKFDYDGHPFSFTERVRLIDKKEMNHLFQQANLNIIHTFGDYQLGAFQEGSSPRLITIAQKDGTTHSH